MPFDLSQQTAGDALAAFHAAGPDADWRAIAEALAAHVKAPKAKTKPEAGEWCEYTPAMHKGRGGMFKAGNSADVTFADGVTVRVSLRHRNGKPLPDWARAMRCAVRFYRAKAAFAHREQLIREWDATDPHKDSVSVHGYIWQREQRRSKAQLEGERAAAAITVPAIVSAVDCARGARVNVAMANAATADMRN